MAGFEVSINGRFWVSTEDASLPVLDRGLNRTCSVSALLDLDKHLDAPRGELIFDVTRQKPLRFLLLPQHGIQVAKRESTHEYVRLFP